MNVGTDRAHRAFQVFKRLEAKPLKIVAEREGFEPPDPFESTVFKTAAFDHSATSPHNMRLDSGWGWVAWKAKFSTLVVARIVPVCRTIWKV